MSPSSNQLLSLPNELQTLIWQSYLTHVVLKEMDDKVTVYIDTYPDYKLDARCGLSYHGFTPFQSDVSGQRKVHTDYGDMESEESEYDSGSEDYRTDSDSDSD
jgi:hypothetical protein